MDLLDSLRRTSTPLDRKVGENVVKVQVNSPELPRFPTDQLERNHLGYKVAYARGDQRNSRLRQGIRRPVLLIRFLRMIP